MANTKNKIENKIKSAKPKTILFTEDFREFGSPAAVKTALHRLVQNKVLHRLGRGIYAKAEYSKFIDKEILPSFEEVAVAIAQRDNARIIPTGSYALYALGLSTQIPMKIVYLTDGTPRKIEIGKAVILFKRTSPRNLSYRGELSTLVVQALKEIGNGNITDDEEKKLIGFLKKGNYNKLKHDIAIAPQWISEIMAKALPL